MKKIVFAAVIAVFAAMLTSCDDNGAYRQNGEENVYIIEKIIKSDSCSILITKEDSTFCFTSPKAIKKIDKINPGRIVVINNQDTSDIRPLDYLTNDDIVISPVLIMAFIIIVIVAYKFGKDS